MDACRRRKSVNTHEHTRQHADTSGTNGLAVATELGPENVEKEVTTWGQGGDRGGGHAIFIGQGS